jgi:hypothetical protein
MCSYGTWFFSSLSLSLHEFSRIDKILTAELINLNIYLHSTFLTRFSGHNSPSHKVDLLHAKHVISVWGVMVMHMDNKHEINAFQFV